MAKAFESKDVLHAPETVRVERDAVELFFDPERGNWIGTDPRGRRLMELVDGSRTFGDIVGDYARDQKVAPHEAQQHAATFFGHMVRREFLRREPFNGTKFEGRPKHLKPVELREMWIHTNNSCNLTCAHCLVSSGPDEDKGLPTDKVKDIIDQGRKLGVRQFFFTGGEPFVRKDIYELIEYVTKDSKLIILTNGLLFTGKRLESLRKCDREKLGLQISIDGSCPEVNDPIRGEGSFKGIVEGIRTCVKEGFETVVTSAVCRANADDVPKVTKLAAELGAKNHHLLWPHLRGRARDSDRYTIDAEGALKVLRECRKIDGILVDNWESFKLRVGAERGPRYDLSNAGYESLCVYSDGNVYPSAALANIPDLKCGSILDEPLEKIWKESSTLNGIRTLTVAEKPTCRECPIRYVCGGGDIEHSYSYAEEGKGVERMWTLDPYCELYKQSYYEAMEDLSHRNNGVIKTGFHRPVPYYGRGDGLNLCHEDPNEEVSLGRSACVLSVTLDKARRPVQEFYSDAADTPQKDLCCPTAYPKDDTAHIPQEVLDVFYGCGSPVSIASLTEGETAVDLGSGGGIDCFIAAKKVGPKGKVFGIDMTDAMLGKARKNSEVVARRLGYANVEFKKGYLEEIPLPDQTADLIMSNCVINLSPDKKLVFREMWRVLKDFGRILVSDIVSDREIPPRLEMDPKFRGECLGGALTQDEFLADLERSGFYGLSLLEKTFWKEVEGLKFYSVSVRGFKFHKKDGCKFVGQWALYLGPYQSVTDEEGHLFPRNEAVEICTDTAAKLSAPPYKDFFVVFDGEAGDEFRNCNPESGCC